VPELFWGVSQRFRALVSELPGAFAYADFTELIPPNEQVERGRYQQPVHALGLVGE
jgi:hypothetical protein